MPTRPGNNVYHGQRRDFWDHLERGIFYVAVPAGAAILIILGGGYLISEVAAWV